ncbi:MAG: class I SAM-dependent methyltransferase [Thermus sp.]|uniref:class I SAM-dependent methyltransferase n=1 Tax=Thermus sp. TaxID=275 RepID=UPI00391C2F04
MSPENVARFERFRRYPDQVLERVASAILGFLPSGEKPPTLLELGVGTGAMALPLIARGCRYLALDRDPEMLWRFRERVGEREGVEILEADARAIPLPHAWVDGVLVVRFWHLVSEWPRVLAEAIRVLRPGGVLLEGFERITSPGEESLFQVWEAAVRERGGVPARGLHRKRHQEVGRALRALGLSPKTLLVVRWRETRRAREFVDLLQERVFHFTHGVPEEAHQMAMERVWAYVESLGGPEAPLPAEKRFYLRVTRKEGG